MQGGVKCYVLKQNDQRQENCPMNGSLSDNISIGHRGDHLKQRGDNLMNTWNREGRRIGLLASIIFVLLLSACGSNSPTTTTTTTNGTTTTTTQLKIMVGG